MGADESTTATLSGRRRLVAYSAMAGLATFALLLVLSLMYIRQSDELIGGAQAAYVHRDIELSLNDAVEFSNTIAGTFSSFAFIDSEQFRRMVAEKLGHSALFRAALYAPKIVEPTGFEAEMRRDGHDGYLVHDRIDDASERSPWREWYLPVSHREPQPPRALRDLGLDIGASPATRDAIARARGSGALVRQLVDGLAPTLNGIWFIKAVYTGRAIPRTEPERRERFRGIVAVIVDPSELFSEPLPAGMGYTLSLDSGPSRKALVTAGNHEDHGFADRNTSHEFALGLDSGRLVLSLHCHHRWQVYDAGLILASVLGGLGVGFAIFLLGRSWVSRAQVLAERNAHIENEVERQTQALRESETRLRESEQRMRAITQHAPGGISLKSLDGQFLFLNPTFERWFAADEGELVGNTNDCLYHESDVIERISAMDEEVRQTLRAARGEITTVFPDAVTRTMYLVKFPIFDDQGKHSAIGTIALDLSEQREAERARAQSDAQFRELVESTVQGIFIHRRGKILFANQALADLLGMNSPDDALALDSIIDIFTPQEQERIRGFKTAREQGLPAPDRYESKVQRTDGSVLNVEVSPKRVIWNGEAAIQGTIHDVTVWRRAEDSMRRRQQAAETANQAKSEFLANMSHELRTPLNGVLGVLELLDHSPLNAEQTDFVRTAMDSGEALLNLINDVLDLSKIEAGKLVLEQVDFATHDLFDGVMHVVALRAQEKSLRIDALIEPNVPSIVTSDPTRLRQVVLNLLANAVKFTEKGYVRLRVGYHAAAHSESTARLIVEISDSGIGISKQAKSQIFDAFSQADGSTTRRFGGTGLGLSISRHIIARMDGDVEVDSAPGKGSTFTVSVPIEVPRELAADNGNAEVAAVRRELAMLVVSRDAFTRASVVARAQALGLTAMSTETLSTIDSLIDAPEQPPLLVCIEHDLLEPSTLPATLRRVGDAPVQVAIMAPLGTPLDGALDTTGVVRLRLPIRTDDLSNLIDQCAAQSRDDRPMGEGTLTELATLALVRDRARQVLVVEDNPVNLKVAEKMLERLGCVVTVARDGAQALDLLGEDPYDIILMDCQMPVMDGYESARRIRARSDAHSATPILALTANAMDGDEEKCLRAGMNAHISKPVTLARLEEELELWAPVARTVPTDGDTDVPEERAAVNG